jgi:hypothetical protein
MSAAHYLPEDPDEAVDFLEERLAEELEELDAEFEAEIEDLAEDQIEELVEHHERMKEELQARHEAMVAWQRYKAGEHARAPASRSALWDIFGCCRHAVAARGRAKKLRRAQAKLRALHLLRQQSESLAARREFELVPLKIPPRIIPKVPQSQQRRKSQPGI